MYDNLNQLKKYEKLFPGAYIYENISNLGIDIEQLEKTNPYLFEQNES